MKFTSTRNDIELMRRETIWLYNEKLYIFIGILLFIITIDILISIKKQNYHKSCIVLMIIFFVCFFIILKNIKLVNDNYRIYSNIESTDWGFEVKNNTLFIDSVTTNRHFEINEQNIKKILYKKYSVFLYTNDNKIYCIPNSIYLVDYLKNKLHLQ